MLATWPCGSRAARAASTIARRTVGAACAEQLVRAGEAARAQSGPRPVEVTAMSGLELHYPNGLRLPAGTALEQVAACLRLYSRKLSLSPEVDARIDADALWTRPASSGHSPVDPHVVDLHHGGEVGDGRPSAVRLPIRNPSVRLPPALQTRQNGGA